MRWSRSTPDPSLGGRWPAPGRAHSHTMHFRAQCLGQEGRLVSPFQMLSAWLSEQTHTTPAWEGLFWGTLLEDSEIHPGGNDETEGSFLLGDPLESHCIGACWPSRCSLQAHLSHQPGNCLLDEKLPGN